MKFRSLGLDTRAVTVNGGGTTQKLLKLSDTAARETPLSYFNSVVKKKKYIKKKRKTIIKLGVTRDKRFDRLATLINNFLSRGF
jgi:hypothetical protein